MVTLMIQLQVATTVLFCGCDNGFQELGFLLKCAAKFENLPKISIFCEVFLFWKIIMQIQDFSRLFSKPDRPFFKLTFQQGN